jgi:hypothetical protein
VSSFTFGTSGESYMDWDLSTCVPLNLVAEEELSGSAGTCEFDPGPPPVQGRKNTLCVGDGCLEDTPENVAFIESLRWKVVVTAA